MPNLRCPNCQNEVSSSARNCYYCGAALPAQSAQPYQPPQEMQEPTAPKGVPSALGKFFHSPMVLLSIIAYTIYAGIFLIEFIPLLKYIDDCFALISVSIFLFVQVFSVILSFVPPLVISVGLWEMYSSEGQEGAAVIKGGISAYIALLVAIMLSAFMLIITSGHSGVVSDYMIRSRVNSELILPLAYCIFGLFVASALRTFVGSVEYTAFSGEANTDGAVKAGTMVLIYVGISLISVFGVLDFLSISESVSDMFGDLDSTLSTISNLAHLLALGLFGILAFSYCKRMDRANQIDSKNIGMRITGEGKDLP